MHPYVSVICPVRNEEKYIAECLQSLIEQTYNADNMEILVIDGMSEDRTRQIVRQFQLRHKSIRLIDNPDRIVSMALNIGVRSSAGKYLLRMDGHAKAAHDYVEKCVNVLEIGEADCVGGPIISKNQSETGQAIAIAMSSVFGVGNSRFRTSKDKRCYVDTLAFPAFKREVFDRFGLFDKEMVRSQDDEFNFRIRRYGAKILLAPEIRSWYYPRSSFRGLWRQYFGYGYWKVRILQKHFWMMQWRHFVPVAFVGGLIFCLCWGLFIPALFLIFASIMLLYGVISVIAASHVWKRNKKVSFARILISFYILHFSYGSGFFCGLIKFFPRWFKKEKIVQQEVSFST